jgi:phosphoglucomutase/phosphomannomutase
MSSLAAISERLVEDYSEAGAVAAKRLERWLSGELPFAHPEVLERHLAPDHTKLLFDAFWQILPFGTGGRRGRVGYGANRMNETTVAMTVQGHCNYLKSQHPERDDLQVVVANDVRVFRDLAGSYAFLGDDHPLIGASSRSFGRLACEIYAGNGITAWFARPEADDAMLTTPELSFLIAELEAAGGINLSASHNPPDDNGIKTYDAFGSQPVAPDDQALIDVMETASQVRSLPFAEALAQGRVRSVPESTHRTYLDLYVKLYDELHRPDPAIPITYTPLCGCGLDTAGAVLERLGFPVQVPPDQGPDGSFAPIPFRAPNPEVAQATAPARAFAAERGSSIVLSSDPDADRIGLEIRLPDGSWFHFDGNQIAAVLAWFLMLDPEGPQRRGLVIETLVTTKILGRIVEEAGDSQLIDDLLVGFKYVADVLKRLERGERYSGVACSPERLVLAAEESHGVIMLPGIRDKDATPACMLLAALHQRESARGRTLLDYYTAILERLGGYDNVNRSVVMLGADGIVKKDRIMASLRERPPREIGGQPVRRVLDFWDEEAFGPFRSESDRLPRNVIQLQTDGFIVTIRPSGTEPKLKLYCQLLPDPDAPSPERGSALLAAVRSRAEETARQGIADLLRRIDVEVGTAALLLPDIIDLDQKLSFEGDTAPALRAAIERNEHADLDALLDWLRTRIAGMTPGTDPLPAVKAPLHWLCERWREEGVRGALLEALAAWARVA